MGLKSKSNVLFCTFLFLFILTTSPLVANASVMDDKVMSRNDLNPSDNMDRNSEKDPSNIVINVNKAVIYDAAYHTYDDSGDGNSDSVEIVDIDIDLPSGVSGTVTIKGYLYTSAGSQINSVSDSVYISGEVYDSDYLDLGSVSSSGYYYVTLKVYYSSSSTADDTLSSDDFYLYKYEEPAQVATIYSSSYDRYDASGDGNYDSVKITGIDIDLPSSTSGNVNIKGMLYAVGGTLINTVSDVVYISGDGSDSDSLDLGSVTSSGSYYYRLEAYYSSTTDEDDSYTSSSFYLTEYEEPIPKAAIVTFSYATYDGSGDMKNDSATISVDVKLTWEGTGTVTVKVSLRDSDSVEVSNGADSVYVILNTAATIEFDMGSVDEDGYYRIFINAFYTDSNVADDSSNTAYFYLYKYEISAIADIKSVNTTLYDNNLDGVNDSARVEYDIDIAVGSGTHTVLSVISLYDENDTLINFFRQNYSIYEQQIDVITMDLGCVLTNGSYYFTIEVYSYYIDRPDYIYNGSLFYLYANPDQAVAIIKDLQFYFTDNNTDGRNDTLTITLDIDLSIGNDTVLVVITLFDEGMNPICIIEENYMTNGSTISPFLLLELSYLNMTEFYFSLELFYYSNVSDDSILDGIFYLHPLTTVLIERVYFYGIDDTKDSLPDRFEVKISEFKLSWGEGTVQLLIYLYFKDGTLLNTYNLTIFLPENGFVNYIINLGTVNTTSEYYIMMEAYFLQEVPDDTYTSDVLQFYIRGPPVLASLDDFTLVLSDKDGDNNNDSVKVDKIQISISEGLITSGYVKVVITIYNSDGTFFGSETKNYLVYAGVANSFSFDLGFLDLEGIFYLTIAVSFYTSTTADDTATTEEFELYHLAPPEVTKQAPPQTDVLPLSFMYMISGLIGIVILKKKYE